MDELKPTLVAAQAADDPPPPTSPSPQDVAAARATPERAPPSPSGSCPGTARWPSSRGSPRRRSTSSSTSPSTDTVVGLGLGLVAVSTMAASVGGTTAFVAREAGGPRGRVRPFVTTFCDAAGLLVYVAIARVVLGL